MNILEKIIAHKKIEVEERKKLQPVQQLEQTLFFKNETLSLKEYLLSNDRTGIIAEFKRKSPSKGVINNNVSVSDVTSAYSKYGASALSVLTDEEFFGGSMNDLQEATINNIPILRKDFMIDEYQIIESKTFGASVILLIAACLSKNEVKKLASLAKNIGLSVLLEIHNEKELEHICNDVDVVGVNNRDLKTFAVDINRSIELSKLIPSGMIKISESGIDDPASIKLLKKVGYKGFLIGEKFMKHPEPAIAFAQFTEQLKDEK